MIATSVTITRTSSGILEGLPDKLKEARRWECAIGFPKGGKKDTGTPHYRTEKPGYSPSILEVANFNNFGLGVPRRPFMELAAKNMQPKFQEILDNTVQQFIEGNAKFEKILAVAGEMGVAAVKDSITNGNWTPNSRETIAHKGSSKPLIDTGDMRKAVEYVVREAKG